MTFSPASSAPLIRRSTVSGGTPRKPISAPPKPRTLASIPVFPRVRFCMLSGSLVRSACQCVDKRARDRPLTVHTAVIATEATRDQNAAQIRRIRLLALARYPFAQGVGGIFEIHQQCGSG